MKKYKIGKYIVDATSPIEAMKAVQTLKDSKIKDYKPPYAIWVKENGKWKIYSGSNSANVDRNAFLAKGYEDVKVVKNGDDVKDSKVKDSIAADIVSEIKRYFPNVQISTNVRKFNTSEGIINEYSININNAKELGDGFEKFIQNLKNKYRSSDKTRINIGANGLYIITTADSAIKDSVKDSNISNAYSEIKRFYPEAELFATTKNGMGAIVIKNANSLGSGFKQFLTNINKKYGRPHAGFGGRPTDEIDIVGNEALIFIKDSVKDEAFDRQTIEALIADETAAIDAYNVAIANLKGKISDLAIKVLQAIRDDEQNHVANLNAILSNNITEKNLEDSIKDARKILATKLKKGDIIFDNHNNPYKITSIDFEDTYVSLYADNMTGNGNARFTFDNDELVDVK